MSDYPGSAFMYFIKTVLSVYLHSFNEHDLVQRYNIILNTVPEAVSSP